MFQSLVTLIVNTIGALGYPGIIALMALESSFFPFPSEVVMVPAGYLVQKGEMNMTLVVLMGIVGSLIGAWLNYAIARTLGRAALLKYGHFLFLTEERFRQVEHYLKEHGEIGTFIGRLIPGVRQYISFPAGLVHMPIGRFSFWTAFGAGLWVTVLSVIGYFVGENEVLVKEWTSTAVFWLLIGCLVIVVLYCKMRR